MRSEPSLESFILLVSDSSKKIFKEKQNPRPKQKQGEICCCLKQLEQCVHPPMAVSTVPCDGNPGFCR